MNRIKSPKRVAGFSLARLVTSKQWRTDGSGSISKWKRTNGIGSTCHSDAWHYTSAPCEMAPTVLQECLAGSLLAAELLHPMLARRGQTPRTSTNSPATSHTNTFVDCQGSCGPFQFPTATPWEGVPSLLHQALRERRGSGHWVAAFFRSQGTSPSPSQRTSDTHNHVEGGPPST